jgi:hypothetical protein
MISVRSWHSHFCVQEAWNRVQLSCMVNKGQHINWTKRIPIKQDYSILKHFHVSLHALVDLYVLVEHNYNKSHITGIYWFGFYAHLKSNGTVVRVLNQLSTTPWRLMGEWMYTPAFTRPRHLLKVSGQLHVRAAFTAGKEFLVSIG